MRVFKARWFVRFAKSVTQPWPTLWHAPSAVLDADLGGGIIKQRVARPGEGKSGGYRTVSLPCPKPCRIPLWLCQERPR